MLLPSHLEGQASLSKTENGEVIMSIRLMRTILFTCLYVVCIHPAVHAQLIGNYGFAGQGQLQLNIDGVFAENPGGQVLASYGGTGRSVSAGSSLTAGVVVNGVQCQGCSAQLTCYANTNEFQQTPNPGLSIIFQVTTTVNLTPILFSWTAPSPGQYYIFCDVNYYNNPYAGNPASALTPNIIIPVT